MTEKPQPKSKQRNAEIEFLRFWAAFSVCAYHVGIFSGGLLAVDFFFILTGALLTRSLVLSPQSAQRTILSYVYKQIKSLYPELCVAILVTLVLKICLGHASIAYIMNTIANDLCFLRMSRFTQPWSGACPPTWYLSSMLMATILTYPVISRIKNPLLLFCLACFPLTFLILRAGGMQENSFADLYGITYSGNYRAIGGILMGATVAQTAALLKKNGITNKHRMITFLLKWVSIVGISVLFIHQFRPLEPCIHLLSSICLTLIFVHIDAHRKEGILSSLCRLLGRLSLPLYLSHWIILTELAPRLKTIPAINQYHLFYPCLVLLIIVSTCFTYAGAQYIRLALHSHTARKQKALNGSQPKLHHEKALSKHTE